MSLVLPSWWKGIDASSKERDFKWWLGSKRPAILTVFWVFCCFTSKNKKKIPLILQMWNFDGDYNNESSNGDLQVCLIQFWASPCKCNWKNEGRRSVHPDICHSSTDETTALVAELLSMFLQLREISLSCLVLGGENNLCTGNKCC